MGAVIMLAGVTVLTLSLRDAGERLFCGFGFVGFLVGSVFWLIYLAFRLTATEWAAQELERTGITPASYQMLRIWAGSFFGIYLVLAYSAIAAYGAALLKTGLSPRWLGRTCVVWGITFSPIALMAREDFASHEALVRFAAAHQLAFVVRDGGFLGGVVLTVLGFAALTVTFPIGRGTATL